MRPVICLETGRCYKNASEVAIERKVTTSTITRSCRSGYAVKGFHYCYADEPKPDSTFFDAGRCIAVMCLETNERFPSVMAAARWIDDENMPESVSKRILSAIAFGTCVKGMHFYLADEPKPKDTFFKDKRWRSGTKRPVVCLETGKQYESIAQAARSHGVSKSAMGEACKTGGGIKGLHFYLDDIPKPDENCFENKAKQAVICLETGERFESVTAAAKESGTQAGTLRHCLLEGTTAHGFHFYYADEPKPDSTFFKMPRKRAVICLETGERFESMTAAARKIGVNISTFSSKMKQDSVSIGGYHWKYA